jgi:hypothetical protein
MTPHLDKALVDFERGMDNWIPVEDAERIRYFPGFPIDEWLALKKQLVERDREEARIGADLEGFMGVLWRFIRVCDYRQVSIWYRGEIVRGTPQGFIFDAAAAAVSSIVTQLVGGLVRSQMRPAARELMEHAVNLLEKDITELHAQKKGHAIRPFSVLPGGRDG